MIALTSPVETPYHRLPAGLKLAALCLFTFAIFLAEGLALHLAGLALVAGLYLVGGLRFARAGVAMLRVLVPFLVIIALWHGLTGAFAEGTMLALRLLAAVGLANLVTMTTRLDDMIGVLRWLTAPVRRFGVRTGALELAIALVVRFTPVLAEKGGLLAEAWRARSPRRPGWRIVAPFALLAIDDADHVAEALRARGGVRN